MSCDKWRWTEECDTHICIGDCDYCDYNNEDEEEYTISADSGTVSVGGEQ